MGVLLQAQGESTERKHWGVGGSPPSLQLAGSAGAGTGLGLQGEPPTAQLGLQPAWELGLWPCSRQVLPDHAVPKVVPPPSSARTVLFGEAWALGDAPGASGAFFIAQNCLDVVLVRFEQGAADCCVR